ncbi:hypothetical protein C0J52_06740 [Blattella germanica]|nr:hypothetical protein C0J52_06740 [Blattella germanica]
MKNSVLKMYGCTSKSVSAYNSSIFSSSAKHLRHQLPLSSNKSACTILPDRWEIILNN